MNVDQVLLGGDVAYLEGNVVRYGGAAVVFPDGVAKNGVFSRE